METQQPVRGRFAPTPSGRMHLGNLFCSLLAWLSARSKGGKVVLRIEDLDPERSPRKYVPALEEDLLWLGLDWDEGGSRGGPDAPYYQSERTAVYESCFRRLEEQGLIYPCFCSRAALHAADAPHLSDGQYVYSGRCRTLTPARLAEESARRKPAWRIRVPAETITFRDGNYGLRSEDLARECGDFVLRRADGVFAYQLAVTVDDALMGASEVVRGRDLLGSTARQIYLFRLLGFEPPVYYHVPLLLAPDGRRLSKRDGDLGLDALRRRFRPEDIVGIFARLCGLISREEPLSARELLPLFSWDRVPVEDILLPRSLYK